MRGTLHDEQRVCVMQPIVSADQATYTLTASTRRSGIRALVTATNSGGSTSRYSLPTYQIKAAPVLAAAR